MAEKLEIIEPNNPEIDVDKLMQRVRETVERQQLDNTGIKGIAESVPFAVLSSPIGVNSLSGLNMSRIEAFISTAEKRTVRSKLPDKFYSIPFSHQLEKLVFKIFNLLFRDQREVNRNLIFALRESVALNRQLSTQLSALATAVDHVKRNQSLPTYIDLDEPRDYIAEATALQQAAGACSDQANTKLLFYSLFENVFHNSVAVSKKQQIYFQYIDKNLNEADPFLDIGCGRGEFLLNLRENGLASIGVDLNSIEISKLKENGFTVFCADALDYLNTNNSQYSGISAFQVVEHLNFDYLNDFLSATFQRIVPGGVIILETVNPHCLYSLANFYLDPTHIKPIPPEMLIFLLQWHGYKNTRVVYSSLLSESLRTFDEARRNYQDYAIVGYKPS